MAQANLTTLRAPTNSKAAYAVVHSGANSYIKNFIGRIDALRLTQQRRWRFHCLLPRLWAGVLVDRPLPCKAVCHADYSLTMERQMHEVTAPSMISSLPNPFSTRTLKSTTPACLYTHNSAKGKIHTALFDSCNNERSVEMGGAAHLLERPQFDHR